MFETIMVIFVVGLFYWLWMLVDCIYYESKEWDKIIWLCIIVLLNFFGAVVYMLLRFKTNRLKPVSSEIDKLSAPR